MAAVGGADTRSLQTHIEEIRSLTLCKICLRPFYEPYILECGHTFCYDCLKRWLGGSGTRGKNKNCPDCRAAVRSIPAPNYLLRDIAHLFVGRAELLPERETIEEHELDKATEAQQVLTDRKGHGLFQGLFSSSRWSQASRLAAPFRDTADNVFRCPTCMWELEEGECGRCGWSVPSDDEDVEFSVDGSVDEDEDEDGSELSLSSSVLDGEEYDVEIDSHPNLPHLSNGPAHFYPVESGSEDESESDGSEAGSYDLQDTFVDNEGEGDADDLNGDEFADYPQDPATPYSDDTSNAGDDQPVLHLARRHGANSTNRVIQDSDDEVDHLGYFFESDEEDSNIPVPQRRRPIVISDDEDSEGHEVDNDVGQATSARYIDQARGAEDQSDEPSGEPSEDADHESQSESSTSNSEESDDTIGPPQTIRRRRKHLQEQRARRPHTSRVIDLRTPPTGHHRRRGRSTAVH